MFWNVKEIDAPELARWIEGDEAKIRVIDVREFSEIAAGTIEGAEPMPLATVPVRMSELDKDEKLVFICRSGARSAQACAYLQQFGFDNVYNLRGGMIGWVQNGLPARALPRAV